MTTAKQTPVQEPKFSMNDAQAIVQLIRTAPLQSMEYADNVMGILRRFVDHANTHFTAPATLAAAATAADKKTAKKK